jgi:FKBP-type peptidyl-prolyl cis-trans isomerase SlyD
VSYQAGPGTVVSLAYAVYDAEGEQVDASDQPLEIVLGYGTLLPSIEQVIEGLEPGQKKSLRLGPEQAYGRRDPKALIEVDRSEFPEDVAPGDRFDADAPDGTRVVLRVLDVTDELVVIDTNHPLADQTVRFELEVIGVRPASEAELAAAEARLREAENRPRGPPAPLISVQRLLEGGKRRYESGPGSDAPAEDLAPPGPVGPDPTRRRMR